jgi:hypothetical protein
VFYLLLGLLVCLGLGAVIWSIIYTSQASRSSPRRPEMASRPRFVNKGGLGRKGYSLQKKLLRMLHHDQATVDRLLSSAELKHPGRSQQWYLEKVIYDLERDRRS